MPASGARWLPPLYRNLPRELRKPKTAGRIDDVIRAIDSRFPVGSSAGVAVAIGGRLVGMDRKFSNTEVNAEKSRDQLGCQGDEPGEGFKIMNDPVVRGVGRTVRNRLSRLIRVPSFD